MGSSSIHNSQPQFFTLGWEKDFDVEGSLDFLMQHWYIPFLTNLLFYIPLIVIGPMIMKNREPFKAKTALMIWNSILSIFSILGFIHVLPEFIYTLSTHGFHHSVCYNSYLNYKSVAFWHYLFALSKIPELIDTIFLVIRKNNLIFLHVYHHATVVIFAWFHHGVAGSAARWYNTMNYGIHSIMYTYYVLKCVPHIIRIPKSVSMLITTMQTVQMVIGTNLILYTLYNRLIGHRCNITWPLGLTGTVMYISFLYLFAKFFYDAYLAEKPSKSAAPIDKKRV